MSNIPTILGFPLWYGHIARRVAKKRIRRWRHGWMLDNNEHTRALRNLTIGDPINDCTGQNGKILRMVPDYVAVGLKRRGFILVDVDIYTENTGCSLISCGIEPALSRETIEARMRRYIVEWMLHEDPDLGRKRLDALDAGGHIIGDDGRILPEFGGRPANTWSGK